MTRKLLFTLSCAVAVITFPWSTAYADDNSEPLRDKIKDPAIAALTGNGARIGYHRETGRVNFVGFGAGKSLMVKGAAPGLESKQNAMAVLQQYAPLFGIKSPATELRLLKQITANSGRTTNRYQQIYKDLPVIGAEMIVNLDGHGRLLSINGEASTKLALVTTAEYSPSQAVETAVASVARHYQLATTSLSASEPVLSVYDPRLLGPNTHPTLLVWQLEVSAKDIVAPVREYVLVDAIRGNIVLRFNQIHNIKARFTYDAGGTTTLPGIIVCNELNGDACTSGANVEADFAHLYAGDTYDFYMTTHARDSLNNAGMYLISSVNYNDGACPNAYWSGSQMVYCLGVPQGDDVVSHELTHGVTEHTSNLFYYYQSGAINESLSDVWGEFVDLSNGSADDTAVTRWQIGEGTALGVIRDMEDPTTFGDPDKMTSALYNATPSDNGGVHTNSGINNKAVYLMVDGGNFNGQSITAMGITKVAKIYYEAQTTLLTSASDYLDLYNALYQSCQNLVGTVTTNADCTNVRNATLAVEMHLEPIAGYNPEAVVCPAGYSPVNSFYDDIESGLSNWTFSHDTSLTAINWFDWYVAVPSYPYASSGLHSLLGFNVNTTSDQFASISATVPNTSGHTPYLHFNHAYNFHAGSYDGGVLEYSINGGSTWIDASSLFESGRDYNGTVGSAFSNPLAGRSAYVDDSHGYVSTRLDLASLAGQSVDFRWRVGTDSVADLYAYGWWLDDVRIYHCNQAPVATAQGLTTDEDTGLGITLTGTDADGDSISYSVSAAPSNGTLTGTAPNLIYTPNTNFHGADSFSYTVDDGAGGSDSAVITITVNSINDAPSAANLVSPADSLVNLDGASVIFKWQPSTDVDGDTVSYEHKLCTDPALTLNCNTVTVASLQPNILVAGIGGGSLLLLGLAGMSLRRKQLVWVVPLYVAIAFMSACSSGSSDPDPVDTSISTTVTGLNPNTTYYWKVAASDGNGGSTDSSIWSFTTKP